MTPKDKRSPLKEKPLRLPGQSLDEEIQNKTNTIIFLLFAAGSFIIFTVDYWFMTISLLGSNWYNYLPLTVILGTIFTLILTMYSSIKIPKLIGQIDDLKLARDGERIVAEELQTLLTQGAAVLHDILGEKFNVDHVLISNHGVFVLETKTLRKTRRGDAVISMKNSRVFANGYEIQRNPIKQAKALSHWVRDLLYKSTGKKFSVRPVVLFPGWFVEPMQSGQEVWVLNPKALPTFVANEPIVLKAEDVHLATFHLSRYIRAHSFGVSPKVHRLERSNG